jgi:peptide deformylase
MVKNIIQIGDPRLSQISEPVKPADIASREIKELIVDLLDTCKANADSSAGLSAVQLGILKRIYIVRRVDKEGDEENANIEWDVMINPEVTILNDAQSVMWEGCMSVGTDENRLFAPVTRYDDVRVDYTDQEGNPQSLTANGYLAHIIQHEQDHLDGKLFLRYVTNPRNIWKGEELDKYVHKHQAYPPIAN